MGRDDDRGVLADIACRLLGSFLDDEAAEAAKIDILSVGQAVLDATHKALDDSHHVGNRNAGRLMYLFCYL